MGTKPGSPLLRVIHNIVDRHCDEQKSDRDLLIRFVEERDQNAFTTLVWRHGSMVMGVGLRLLRHYQDAEDVCQATFLLLAQKANTTAWRDPVAHWLYEVAYHLSLKARQAAEKRKAHEGKVQPKTPADPLADITARDLQHVLDEELSRMAKKYRTPLILCCLEGKSRDEAARFLGVPLSTVISRLEEGRELLRRRLARRGVPLSWALAGVTLLSETARAAVSATLARATSQVALQVIAGEAITNLVSTNVSALVKGGMQTMFVIKLKVAMAVLLAAGLLVSSLMIAGLGTSPASALAQQPESHDKGDKAPGGKDPGKDGAQKTVEKLQGIWQVVAYDSAGKPLGGAGRPDRLVFAKDKIIFQAAMIDDVEVTYRLDLTKKPKQLDMTITLDGKDVTLPGIYHLEGDTLKICFHTVFDGKEPGDRPKEFATTADTLPGVILTTLKRKKP
jgi:RNA polymerase sigma factor (sigma-70 family)